MCVVKIGLLWSSDREVEQIILPFPRAQQQTMCGLSTPDDASCELICSFSVHHLLRILMASYAFYSNAWPFTLDTLAHNFITQPKPYAFFSSFY